LLAERGDLGTLEREKKDLGMYVGEGDGEGLRYVGGERRKT
jgi:hypothetical protein